MSETNTIPVARAIFRDAFASDPFFRETYVANVACKLMDNSEDFRVGIELRNRVASEIVDLFYKD